MADGPGSAPPRKSLSLRLAIAKQFVAAAGGVLMGHNPARRVRSALQKLAGGPPVSAPASRPRNAPALRAVRGIDLAGTDPVCVFVAYAPDGRLFDHTVRYCADLRRAGMRLVLVVVTDRPDLDCRDPGSAAADALLVRENAGYDFAAWADALRLMPQVWQAREIWFANDSVYHSPRLLGPMVERARASAADVVAMTASTEVANHFQSYCFAIKAEPARRGPARAFWESIAVLEDKLQVIRDYEVRQKAVLEAGGLSLDVLYPLPAEPRNHLHHSWRALLEAGFPFVKIELLRDNPYRVELSGWRTALDAQGFDVEAISFHLGARPSGAAGLMELR